MAYSATSDAWDSQLAPKIVALVHDRTLLTEWLGLADSTAMENQGVGRADPSFWWQRVTQLLLHDLRTFGPGNTDAVRHS
jgi:hypothetical protein